MGGPAPPLRMRNAAAIALLTSLVLALVGISLAVSEHAETRARLDQRLALQADGEAGAVAGLFTRTRLALRLLAADAALRDGVSASDRGAATAINRALGSLERAEPGLAGAASAIGLDGRERARVVRGEAAPGQRARARRPQPAVLPRHARHAARRRARLAAVPLGRHRPVGRVELRARARRPRTAARDRALRAAARERAGDGRGRARAGGRSPGRGRRSGERAQDPRHLARRARGRAGDAARVSRAHVRLGRRGHDVGGRAAARVSHADRRAQEPRLGRHRRQPPAVAPRCGRDLSRRARAARGRRRARRRRRHLAARAAPRRDAGAAGRRGRPRRGRAALAHRCADGPLQPPPRARLDRRRARPLRAHRRATERDAARSRPLPAHQRRLRPCRRRSRAERDRRAPAGPAARLRRARPLGRRGVHRARAGRAGRRDAAPAGRADPPARRRAARWRSTTTPCCP